MNVLAANSFPAIQKRDNRLISPGSLTAALRLPWQRHRRRLAEQPAPRLTFGHLIEDHVDQDVGATPARTVAANRRREMRTRQAVLPPLPTRPRQPAPSVIRGPRG